MYSSIGKVAELPRMIAKGYRLIELAWLDYPYPEPSKLDSWESYVIKSRAFELCKNLKAYDYFIGSGTVSFVVEDNWICSRPGVIDILAMLGMVVVRA